MTQRAKAGAKAAAIGRNTAQGVLGLLAGLAVLAATAGASFGADLRMTVEQPHFTCEGHSRHFSDVAFRPGQDDGAPLPCCDGQIGCAQFLSTTTVVRVPRQWHG